MARLTLDPRSRVVRPGFLVRGLLAGIRRRFGADPHTALAMSHHPGVLRSWGIFEWQNGRIATVLPDQLGELVTFVSAVRVGCSWCVDFGASEWERKGLDPAVLREAVSWRQSDHFDERIRVAFEYAEAVCADPVAVDDGLAARVRGHFGENGLVEITFWAALENMRSRFNSALGLSSQGFSSGEVCALADSARAGGKVNRQKTEPVRSD